MVSMVGDRVEWMGEVKSKREGYSTRAKRHNVYTRSYVEVEWP
jgi:hypothetical protein